MFRSWLSESGILREGPDYTDRLSFSSVASCRQFWFPSFVPSELPGFIAVALQAISPHGPYYIARRGGGTWQDGESESTINNQIIDSMLGSFGVAMHAEGAIRFEESEWKHLLAIVLTFYVYGWSVGQEIFILAEERDAILHPSHHGELYGTFKDAEVMEKFRSTLLSGGYDLPTESIGSSFQNPRWLVGRARRGET